MRTLWKSAKIDACQYDVLSQCSRATGIPVAKLLHEALESYIAVTVPVKLEYLSRK